MSTTSGVTTVSRWTLSATWNQHRPESNGTIVGTWSWWIPGNRFQRSTCPTQKSDTKPGPTMFWSKPFLKNLETWKDHRPKEAGKARLFTGESLQTNNDAAHFGENHGENRKSSTASTQIANPLSSHASNLVSCHRKVVNRLSAWSQTLSETRGRKTNTHQQFSSMSVALMTMFCIRSWSDNSGS